MANVTLVETPKGIVPEAGFRVLAQEVQGSGRAGAGGGEPLRGPGRHGRARDGVEKGGTSSTRTCVGWRIQATAGAIGCSWCTDFGYYEGVQQGVDPRKVRDVSTVAFE